MRKAYSGASAVNQEDPEREEEGEEGKVIQRVGARVPQARGVRPGARASPCPCTYTLCRLAS